jgi:threonine/homoserine/homoserine lactone efflux protein
MERPGWGQPGRFPIAGTPEWNFMFFLSIGRSLAFPAPHVYVLAAAFLMGLAAAVPVGPVNMMAMRRGVAGGWRHTLTCGIGSVTGDLFFFSLALLGGHYLLPDLSNPVLQTVLAAVGIIILFPAGIYFVAIAVKEPRKAFNSARKRWGGPSVPAHLIAEAAEAFALTIFNPFTVLYWIGVTSNWLPFAYQVLGPNAPGWGILMAAAGLATWFTGLTVLVRVIPHGISAHFFRIVNAVLGLILIGFALFCAVILSRYFLH